METYESHEFANIFPLMNKKEFKELVKDIEENGQQEEITLYQGKILDGRNRYNACLELGIKPNFKEYMGKDALSSVMSINLKRRHLTDSQKAVVGRRYKFYYAKIYKDRKNDPFGKHSKVSTGNQGVVELIPPDKARDKAGEVVGVSGRYIDLAEEVIKNDPEVEEKIMAGETTVKKEAKKQKKKKQKEEIEKLKEVVGEYDVIVIDPPWKYERELEESNEEGHRGTTDYPTLSIQELKKIKIPMKKDCVVWVWVTNSMFKEALELIDSWELERKTLLTWDKQIMGVGHFLRNITEHCFLCFKGKPYFNNTKWTTLISEKRTTHSTKPEIFYKMVEEICAGRKLDYFARKKREGWDVWGNEVNREVDNG